MWEAAFGARLCLEDQPQRLDRTVAFGCAAAGLGDTAALSALERAVERARHGSTVRTARVAARAIRDQSAQSDEVGRLRADLDKLAGENRALRERVDALEQSGG